MMGEEGEAKADDSDYYTPEDPHTTILSPVKSPSGQLEKVCNSTLDQCTDLTFVLAERHCDPFGCD